MFQWIFSGVWRDQPVSALSADH